MVLQQRKTRGKKDQERKIQCLREDNLCLFFYSTKFIANYHESCTKKKKKNAQMHVTVASKHIDMLQEKKEKKINKEEKT